MTWPWGFSLPSAFELTLGRCLLMLTHPVGPFRPGPTIWKASREAWKEPR